MCANEVCCQLAQPHVAARQWWKSLVSATFCSIGPAGFQTCGPMTSTSSWPESLQGTGSTHKMSLSHWKGPKNRPRPKSYFFIWRRRTEERFNSNIRAFIYTKLSTMEDHLRQSKNIWVFHLIVILNREFWLFPQNSKKIFEGKN